MKNKIREEDEQDYNTLIKHLNWQLEVNAALAELYKPLISPKTSIEDTTHVILARAKRLTGSEHGYVGVIDPVTKDLVGYTLTAMMGKECKLDKKNQQIVFPIGKDGRYPKLWGHSLNTLEPFYTNTPHTHLASAGAPKGHVALKRYLALPVMLGEELVGQIALANTDRDYTDRDLAAVQRLGEFFALAIQRKRAEETLRISEEKYHKLFEEAIDGIVLADAETGETLDCNLAICQLVGREKSELIGKPQKILHPPREARDQVSTTFKQHLEGKEGEVIETRVITKTGDIKEVAIKANLLELGDRKVLQGMFRDITENKQAEKELEKHREHLEELVRERTDELAAAHKRLRQAQKLEAIGTLAGGIAHDFNNILGAIVGYTELAKDDLPDDSFANDNLAQVLTAAQRAKEMIQQILTFSRKTKEERKMVLFSEIIEEAAKFLRSTLPATIDISLAIEEKLSPINANPTQLHQVIMNISTNAAHAMRETGGELKIELKEINHYPGGSSGAIQRLAPGKYQHLVISDTGHGMSPGILKRIFEPYFTAKRVGEGTGMGLAVVHGIVKGHGGEITVDSKPGEGTTFHVFLPVTREKGTQQQDQKAEPVSPPQLGSERILFVEDEQMLRDLGQEILKKLGYRVTAAANGAEALECFQESSHPFDLVVTDMAMPRMTGLQLAEECKKIKPGIPVILCTGFSDQVDGENFEAHGIDAFAMKPLRIKEIAGIIRRVLEPK
jgi:PAS domain S-box-containing protein